MVTIGPSPFRDVPSYGFDYHGIDAPAPAQSRNGLNTSFLDSASHLPPSAAIETNREASTLMRQEGPTGCGIIGFPADFSPDFDESSLAYFLNDIMIPSLPVPQSYNASTHQPYQSRTPRDFLDFGTFNVDSLDMDLMFGDHHLQGIPMPNSMPLKHRPASGTQTPNFGDRIASGNAAFMRSVWLWTPTNQDFGGRDSLNLSLPASDMDSPETRALTGHFIHHHSLECTMRDKILGLVLSTCDSSLYMAIASSFPSADLLNKLMHLFMATHVEQTDSWIHLPTIELNDEALLLVIMMVSAGAVICSVPSIRKLGYALQETVRIGLATKFEHDNRATRHLPTLQAFALSLQVGLWSGDKRKMELAESFAQPLITMLRRAGRFRRPKDHVSLPNEEDSTETLDTKWRQWAHAESYKRLACHLLIHDAQASMACQVAPLLSPTEFSLSFPVYKDLWGASSAEEWKMLHLQNTFPDVDKGINISQGINCVSQLKDQQNIDLTFAATLVIHSTWSLVYSNSLLNALTRPQSSGQTNQESPLDTRHNSGIVHLIEEILLNLSDWEGNLRPELVLVSERTLLNLHVSFEHVQLFAGKEGEEEARRAFPILQQWVESSDARKAVWHAGQILRAARRCSASVLREFGSICVYHAGLTFWAYAVLLTAVPNKRQSQAPVGSGSDTVWLDGDDVPAVQRFISLNRGTPAVRDGTGKPNASVSPSNPRALMELCISLLRHSPSEICNDDVLPLVDNLNQLMRDLGNAAQGLLSGHWKRSSEHQLPTRSTTTTL
ncbi:hypothetical protein H2200_010823 [Cladophialophora chaetospira]|uniref:Xylanolytic transcriptional activator regulatory domain-containing protein n=1 Tax=Cladophialophora chaetospira TaxID=386627 RepID=A0AA38X0V0_9EURO|nr:hypothetical protein H2200_010823 [Cladophialophora chaetospira]